jgi:hypothetical protein
MRPLVRGVFLEQQTAQINSAVSGVPSTSRSQQIEGERRGVIKGWFYGMPVDQVCRSAGTISLLAACHAGAMPASSPDNSDTARPLITSGGEG